MPLQLAFYRFIGLLGVVLVLHGCKQAPEAPSIEDQVAAMGTLDFNFHVRPILSQNCFECHGNDPESREADLRLDMAEDAYRNRDSSAAIVPGHPNKSLLVNRITSDDPEERMPPPEAHRTLSPLEIGILKEWITQGAEYKPHWAYIPVERPAVPAGPSDWGYNPIDAFVQQRMTEGDLTPSPEADRRTLARRVSFDLTGLPPTPEQVAAFLADTSPEAYEKLVEHLLDSPHFGERMALEWLDVARYADTNGYSIDGGRHMWIWRDWVIQSFNDNKPYDAFITEQIAGDLLPDPSEAQMIATGFNRNHMITHEGGTIPEENLTNYVADRVKTTSEVFMGLTMACAQCHDHKFDPISQRDYYQFFAYFNAVSDKGLDGDRGINSLPSMMARTPLRAETEVDSLERALVEARRRLSEAIDRDGSWEAAQVALMENRGEGFGLAQTQPLKITTPNRGTTGEILEDQSLLINEPSWLAAYNISVKLPEDHREAVTGIRIVFEPGGAPLGRLGHGEREGLEGSFVLTSMSISSGELPSDQVDLYRLKHFQMITASSAHKDYPTEDIRDERRHNGWAPDLNQSGPAHLTVTFDTPIDPDKSPYLTVMVNFGQGDNLMPGKFRILAMTGTDTDLPFSDSMVAVLSKESTERAPQEASYLQEQYRATAHSLAALRHRVANLEERMVVLQDSFPTMVMNTAEEPRITHILNRGQYDQPTEAVTAGTPASLPGSAPRSDRLGLAEWLTESSNPLTARVAVNRYWQMVFGTGIVATAADFGSQGALPSHPLLLDWLAAEFMDSGWDTKHLIKTIVMSATYRQSSRATEEVLEADPTNRWLARGPRFRLQAEFIRDAALQVSGLLVPRLGGPSVRPYQPPGLWKEVSHFGSTPATSQVFVQDKGEKLYRRSLYTYWKRTSPPPSMMAFDAPNREVCVITREVTNTPLQALVLLNDPQFVEASRHVALRILNQGLQNDTERLQFAFELALSRQPDPEELQRLTARISEEYAYFSDHPEEARKLIEVGESITPTDSPAQLAAWTTIANLILNLSENLTKA